jgi:hypothetical protein
MSKEEIIKEIDALEHDASLQYGMLKERCYRLRESLEAVSTSSTPKTSTLSEADKFALLNNRRRTAIK